MLIPLLIISHFTPNFKTTQVSIEKSATAGKHTLVYEKLSDKKEIKKKDLPDAVVEKLLGTLWKEAGPYADWTNEKHCIEIEKFSVQLQNEHKDICESRAQLKAMNHFFARITVLFQN